jgi:hypothetical protein
MNDPVTAAAKIIYAAGRRHRWSGFDRPYDQLDSIGLSEFNAIIESALATADFDQSVGKIKLHPTGLHSGALAAEVLDFMCQKRLGLLGLAACSDVVAAECRFNYWIATEVKGSLGTLGVSGAGSSEHGATPEHRCLSEERWMPILEGVEANEARCREAMAVFAAAGSLDAFCSELAGSLSEPSLFVKTPPHWTCRPSPPLYALQDQHTPPAKIDPPVALAAALMAGAVSCSAGRSAGPNGCRWLARVLRPGRAITGHHTAFKSARNSCKL